MSGNQYCLISAFFISAVIIAEHVQMGSIFFGCDYVVVAIGKIARDIGIISIALTHIEVAIN